MNSIILWVIVLIPKQIFLLSCYAVVRLPIFAKLYSVKFLYKNIERYFKLPSRSSFAKRFAEQVLAHQVYILYETIYEVLKPGSIRIDGLSELKTQMEKAEASTNRSLLIATAHIGNWELVGKAVSESTNLDFYALAKPTRNRFLTQLLQFIREQLGMHVLWTKKNNFQKDLLRLAQKKVWIAFAMDQKPENRNGDLVTFLKEKTEFVNGPATLALKYGSPILTVFCVRIKKQHYQIFSKILENQYTAPEGRAGLTQLLATEIEAIINQYPEQWVWNYKRFR